MKLSRLFAAAVALSTMIAAGTIVSPSSVVGDEIRVTVKGLRNDKGRVGCSLFNGVEGFPRDREKEFREMWVPIHNGSAVCGFIGLPAGTYAVSVLHDENSDGKMDFNWIGMPTKGYGFSNDAKAMPLPPSFHAAGFEYDGRCLLSISINIVYWN